MILGGWGRPLLNAAGTLMLFLAIGRLIQGPWARLEEPLGFLVAALILFFASSAGGGRRRG